MNTNSKVIYSSIISSTYEAVKHVNIFGKWYSLVCPFDYTAIAGSRRWAHKPVNHTSWVAVVTPTHRPKSVRNCCLIELFCGVVCVVTLSLSHFCWCRGFCHGTGSDLLLFVSWTYYKLPYIYLIMIRSVRTGKLGIRPLVRFRCHVSLKVFAIFYI